MLVLERLPVAVLLQVQDPPVPPLVQLRDLEALRLQQLWLLRPLQSEAAASTLLDRLQPAIARDVYLRRVLR